MSGSSKFVDPTDQASIATRPVAIDGVRLSNGFWARWQDINISVTVPAIDQQNEASGRVENFRKVIYGQDETPVGYYFNDSDVYKWLEAAAWSLADRQDTVLEDRMDEIIGLLEAAQLDDGYLNTCMDLPLEASALMRAVGLSIMYPAYVRAFKSPWP